MKGRLTGIIVLLGVLAALAGCAQMRGAGDAEVEGLRPKKIAVLPFHNISGRKDAGRIVADVFVTELFKNRKYRVEEPGNVLQFMMRESIDTVGEMEVQRIRILGMQLNADAVIVGTVEEFDDGLRSGGVPTVSITARMVDSKTGRVVWAGYNEKRGDEYIIIFGIGSVRSAPALAQKVVSEMIEGLTW